MNAGEYLLWAVGLAVVALLARHQRRAAIRTRAELETQGMPAHTLKGARWAVQDLHVASIVCALLSCLFTVIGAAKLIW